MNLEDEYFEKILTVITPFAVGELEEVASFEDKTDVEREEVLKVCMKSLEVGIVTLSRMLKDDSIDHELMEKLFSMVSNNQLEEAAALMNQK